MDLNAVGQWMVSTRLAAFVHQHQWVWATCEIVHFIGLALLVGVAGAFDLRLLGFARQIPVAALHRLMPWAVAGFALNAVTGVLFVFGIPSRYLANPAFWLKLLCLAIAGANVVLFEVAEAPRALSVGSGEQTTPLAKLIAAVSLLSWFGVMYFGRMLPYMGGY
jgi:hypothetical protein